MAENKAKMARDGWLACLAHCICYSLPFIIIAGPTALFTIFITHFLIDKFRLARYVCQLKNWCFTETGYSEKTPAYLATILVMIVDNIMHITINYLSLRYL